MAGISNKENVQEGITKLSKDFNNYFDKLNQSFDETILSGVEKGYIHVMDNTIPILGGMLFIWVVYQAIQLMYGQADGRKIINSFFKFVVILTLLQSWNYVWEYIGDPVINGIPELVGAMAGQEQKTLIASFTKIVFDQIWNGLSQIGGGGVLEVTFGLTIAMTYMVVMVFAVITIGLYFIIFLQCKLILALMIILAPIFIGCAMFETTKNFFNNWVALIFNQFLTLLLLAIATQLVIGVITKVYQDIYPVGIPSLAAAGGLMLSLILVLFTFAAMPFVASSLSSSGFGITSTGVNGLMASAKKLLTKGK